MNSKKIDMTHGSIIKLVFLFALPICFGNILQMLYNTVDSIVIGNFCGSTSLAAVGTSSQPVEMILCIFLGLGTGISILVSQYVGAKDMENLKKTVNTATAFLYICAIPLTILGFFIGPLILKFMGTPSDAWNLAVTYIDIMFLGTLGNIGYNINAGILRGLGDSKSSLFFLLISCFVNIILDFLFVAVFHLDVAGAAAATSIAMFCSWFFSIGYIRKRYKELDFKILPHSIDQSVMKEIIRIGLPLGLNNSIYSIGHILMQGLVNAQGSIFMAGCVVGSKITGIANVAITSMSSAATTFSGQNLGAKNYVRLRKGGMVIPAVSGAITCTTGLTTTFLLSSILVKMFTNDHAVMEIGILYIYCILPFSWMYAVFNSIICYVNGLGEVKYPTIVNIFTLWAVRIPCGYFISYFINGRYVNISVAVSFAFGMTCMIAFYFTKKWKNVCKLADKQKIIYKKCK